MSALVAFLRAQLDADEAAARAALDRYEPDEWSANLENAWPENEVHIARHDPARVLADVAAKRAIVELHTPGEDGRCTTCIEYCGDSLYPTEYAESPCHELRLLAQPYADHEDFDPTWHREVK